MKRVILLLFGISGSAGLIYQTVWARMLLLIFGNTTHSTTTVLSVFMAGLAIGSVVFGYLADRIKNHLRVWALIEIGIGLFSLITLYLITNFSKVFIPETLLEKFLVSSVSILPTTLLMGGTLPILVKFFHIKIGKLSQETAKLYFFNTFGAFIGTFLSSFLLIEVIGLKGTALTASLLNIAIGTIAYFFIQENKIKNRNPLKRISKNQSSLRKITYARPFLIFAIFSFFLSGAISLSYEILWTRLLIPIMGTYTYAFSTILMTVLLGIALGSVVASYLMKRFNQTLLVFGITEFLIGLFAVLSSLSLGLNTDFPKVLRLLMVTIPASIAMGVTFPVVTSFFEKQKSTGFLVGSAYAANTAGAIIGPIITGFFLIPLIGSTQTILTLATINIVIGALLVFFENKRYLKISAIFVLTSGLIMFFYNSNPEIFMERKIREGVIFAKEKGWDYVVYEDNVATTFAYGSKTDSPDEKGLTIDGVHTTTLTSQTKLLAHLPLLIHEDPREMLVIAFGMGTTFRSALTYDINVDAVELVPSVPKVFPLFFPDAISILDNPRGEIIINDGRNFILTSEKKYDVIVSDPPPPINAAGTTVLYSKEFYENAKDNLKKEGILVQWFWYGASEDDFKMLFTSFKNSFDHVLVALTPEGTGTFFLGSDAPFEINKEKVQERYAGRVFDDFNEWRKKPMEVNDILKLIVGDEKTVGRFVGMSSSVSDDFPRTEYFYVRHKLNPKLNISADWVHPIDPAFDKKFGIVR